MSVSALILISSLVCSQAGPEPVRSFSALFEAAVAADGDGQIEELFRSRPREVAYLIDDDLRSFAESDGRAVARLRQAFRAARVADRVFDEQVFSRQAKAVGTLSANQRVRLLQGRRAFESGREAQRERQYERAGKAYSEALSLADDVGDLLGAARAEQALADLAVGAKRFDEAMRLHQRARDLLARFRHPAELRSCRALAMLHERRGEFEQARSNLERMLAAADQSGHVTDTRPVREALVRICQAMGDRAAAKRYAQSD